MKRQIVIWPIMKVSDICAMMTLAFNWANCKLDRLALWIERR